MQSNILLCLLFKALPARLAPVLCNYDKIDSDAYIIIGYNGRVRPELANSRMKTLDQGLFLHRFVKQEFKYPKLK